jgi:sugar phosphate isomerase/epimerase
MNELSRDEDLLATCWTTAGDAAPLRGDEQSPIPLQERVEAAATAGFRGFGLVYADLLVAERDYGMAGIRAMLQDNGLVHLELELLTVWHTERGKTPPAELATVPLRSIVGDELSDADTDQVGTLFEDTANRRRLCGQGSFDLRGCIRALRAAGWTGPWGVEILSEDFRRLPVREATAAAFTTAAAQLGLADDGR